MVVPPGYSVSDLIQAAGKLQVIYEAFFHKYDNAGSRVKELHGHFNSFHTNLINLQWILEQSGRDYPESDACYRTLDECADLLNKYRAFLDKGEHRVQKTWKTVNFPFEQMGIDRLKGQLSLHMQAMNSFVLNILMLRAFREDRESSAAQPFGPSCPRDGNSIVIPEELVELWKEVQIFQYHRKRVQMVRQTGRQVDNSKAESDLTRKTQIWLDMLLDKGLPVPRVPSDEPLKRAEIAALLKNGGNLPRKPGEKSFERSEAFFRRALAAARHSANVTDSSQSGTSLRDLSLGRPPSFTSENTDLEGETDASRRNQAVTSPFFALPPSAMPITAPPSTPSTYSPLDRRSSLNITSGVETSSPFHLCKADIKLSRNRLDIPISAYRITYTSTGERTIECVTSQDGRLVHRLPTGTLAYPFTKHAAFNKPLEVSFLQKCTIIYNGKAFQHSEDPHYNFNSVEDRDQFQSHVRNKILVHTFEVNGIATKASSNLGRASGQHLKLWRDPDTTRHSLSFFSNEANYPSHLEVAVDSFSLPSETKSGGALKLAFRTQDGASVKSRKWSTSRFSQDKDVGDGLHSPSSTVSSPTAPYPRTPSIISFGSVASDSDGRSPNLEDQLSNMKHLEITFTDPEGRERFIVALKEANSNTRSPTLTTRTNSTSQSPFTMAGASPTSPSGLARIETSSGLGLDLFQSPR